MSSASKTTAPWILLVSLLGCSSEIRLDDEAASAAGSVSASASSTGVGGASSTSSASSVSVTTGVGGSSVCELGWGRVLGGPGSQWAKALALSPDGGALVALELYGDGISLDGKSILSSPEPGFVLTKLTANGDLDWVRVMGGQNAEPDRIMSLGTDASGNIFVAGDFVDSIDLGAGVVAKSLSSSMFVGKLSPAGEPLWVRAYACDSSGGLAVDAAGSVAFSCASWGEPFAFGGQSLSGSVFVAKLDAQGAPLWAHAYDGGISPEGDAFRGLPDGRLAMSFMLSGSVDFGDGVMSSPDSDFDAVVLELDGGGDLLWTRRFGGPSTQRIMGLALDASGNVYLGGSTFGPVDLGGGPLGTAHWTSFVGALDQHGNHLFSKTVGGDVFQANVLSPHPSGGVILSGLEGAALDLGCGALLGGDASSSYLARLDGEGACVEQRVLGAGTSYLTAFASNGQGRLAGAGYFQATVDLGQGPVQADVNDAFVLDLSTSCGP